MLSREVSILFTGVPILLCCKWAQASLVGWAQASQISPGQCILPSLFAMQLHQSRLLLWHFWLPPLPYALLINECMQRHSAQSSSRQAEVAQVYQMALYTTRHHTIDDTAHKKDKKKTRRCQFQKSWGDETKRQIPHLRGQTCKLQVAKKRLGGENISVWGKATKTRTLFTNNWEEDNSKGVKQQGLPGAHTSFCFILFPGTLRFCPCVCMPITFSHHRSHLAAIPDTGPGVQNGETLGRGEGQRRACR